MINLHQLHVFVAVVEEANFRAAAARVYLTQPAVSTQVRHLRNEFGLPLLARDGRRVVPTEVGAALYRYATQVLAMTESLRRDVREIATGATEHVVVGGNRAYAGYVLPELVARFCAHQPTVKVSVVDSSNTEIIERVRSGQIDVAVVSASRVPQDLVLERIGTDDLIVIDSAVHPIVSKGSISLGEASGLPLVRTFVDREGAAEDLNRLLVSEGLDPCTVSMEITTWEGVKAAVKLGAGLAVTLKAIVRSEIAAGELRIINVEGFRSTRTISLLCAPRRQTPSAPPVFRALIEFLRRELPLSLSSSATQ